MKELKINQSLISSSRPVYILAEMSANHNKSFENAIKIIHAAKNSGANGVKIQTYSPDTMTINCSKPYFLLKGTIWKGKTLYDLYREASTPWEWQPDLKKEAERIGIDLFSTPFDISAVDFLEKLNMPAYKVASFEIVDIPLLERLAKTKKPIILSTGLATIAEIDEAVKTLKNNGCYQIALLKCTSAYPASPEDANIATIPHLSMTFNTPCGISDHTLGSTVAMGAVTLGACIVEKHFTLSRKDGGPDSSFSMEPDEFKAMVKGIRILEKAIGKINYTITEKQKESLVFRRSLFAVKDINKGDLLSQENIRSIRPGYGLHTRYFKEIIGRQAIKTIAKGTPLEWNMIG